MAKEKSRYITQFPNPSYFKTNCSKEIVIDFLIMFFWWGCHSKQLLNHLTSPMFSECQRSEEEAFVFFFKEYFNHLNQKEILSTVSTSENFL